LHGLSLSEAPDGALLPAARFEQLFWRERGYGEARHRVAEAAGDPRQDLGVLEVGRRLDDRLRAGRGIGGLEDPRADEDAVGAELHAERSVGWSRDPAGGERDHRQAPVLGDPAHELVRRANLLRLRVELVLV